MKAICFFISFSFIAVTSFATNDSIRKICLSTNVAAGLISGEANIYIDYRLSEKTSLQFSYGHRFYSFNLIESGSTGSSIKYLSQQADIIRFGVKRYFSNYNKEDQLFNYLIYRVSFWNLHTPMYANRDGSNGLDRTHREMVSVDKNVINLAFGIGKEVVSKNNCFLDLFISAGFSIGGKKTHRYANYHVGGKLDDLPPNTISKSIAFFPTIEFGCKLGIAIK